MQVFFEIKYIRDKGVDMSKLLYSMKELYEKVFSGGSVVIFGAGDYGRSLVRFCLLHGIGIRAVVVSDKGNAPEVLCGVPVVSLDDELRKDCQAEKSFLVVALNNGKEVAKDIEKRGLYKEILVCTSELLEEIFVKQWEDTAGCRAYSCKVELGYPGIEKDYVILSDIQDNTPLTRAHITTDISDVTPKKTLKDIMGDQYGYLRYIKGEEVFGVTNDDLKAVIYVATGYQDEAKGSVYLPDGYNKIQVGAAGSECIVQEITDADGENISDQNQYYSECTAHYWIWKNDVTHEFVGVNHYRRLQHIDDGIVKMMRLGDIDMILAMPQFTGISFKEFYLKYCTANEWYALADVLAVMDGGYARMLEVFAKSNVYFPCNIFFASKRVFDDYCSFMFRVTFAVRAWFRNRGISERKRYMGYLTEVLENLYIMANKERLKVAYTDVFFKA